jgi:hypothetical protein
LKGVECPKPERGPVIEVIDVIGFVHPVGLPLPFNQKDSFRRNQTEKQSADYWSSTGHQDNADKIKS